MLLPNLEYVRLIMYAPGLKQTEEEYAHGDLSSLPKSVNSPSQFNHPKNPKKKKKNREKERREVLNAPTFFSNYVVHYYYQFDIVNFELSSSLRNSKRFEDKFEKIKKRERKKRRGKLEILGCI